MPKKVPFLGTPFWAGFAGPTVRERHFGTVGAKMVQKGAKSGQKVHKSALFDTFDTFGHFFTHEGGGPRFFTVLARSAKTVKKGVQNGAILAPFLTSGTPPEEGS